MKKEPMDTPLTGLPPGRLSGSFHTRFFPALLLRFVRPGQKNTGSPFVGHTTMELSILLALSLLAAILGYPAAVGPIA